MNITKEEEFGIWREYLKEHHNDIQAVEGAEETLRAIGEDGFGFIAITGRHEENDRPYTELWIEKYFPNTFENIFFTNN